MNQKTIMGLAAAAALVFLMTRGCGSSPEDVVVDEGLSSPARARGSDQILRQTEVQAGLKRFPFSGRKLRVAVTPRGWCNYGDLDAITLDANRAAPAPLLLSLEPLEGSFGAVQSKELKLADLEKGFTQEFKVQSGSSQQMGLYLCLDQARSGRCTGKKIQPIDEIFADYAVAPELLRGSRPPDRVYFFQFLHFTSGDIVTPNRAVFSEAQLSQMQAWGAMAAPSVEKADDAYRGVIDAQSKLMTVRSLAFQAGGGNADVNVQLPRFDKSRCNDTVGDDPRKGPGEGEGQ